MRNSEATTQLIDKAYVYMETGSDYRIYVPFEGNNTQAKRSRAMRALREYKKAKCKGMDGLPMMYPTSNIKLRHNVDGSNSTYKGDGESGSIRPQHLLVCSMEFTQ